MSKFHVLLTGAAILCAAGWIQTAVAEEEGRISMSAYRPGKAANSVQAVQHEEIIVRGQSPQTVNPHGINVGQYPQLNAPLYPAPVQNVPSWTGGTVITNQAFAPHEMLYPHEYHAMYGPFYYQVKGCWVWTPFGMRQHERWKLQGTEVKVKYHSDYKPFSGFHPPLSH